MTPKTVEYVKTFTVESQPAKTYRVDPEKRRIVGMLDGKEALLQAIYKVLMTERYQYEIYNWNYGAELSALIGEPKGYVVPEIGRRITEALLQDDRILSVKEWDYSFDGPKYLVSFTVGSVYGDLPVVNWEVFHV